MLESLRTSAAGAAGARKQLSSAAPDPIEERRTSKRVRLEGAELFLFPDDHARLRLRVRDFGCTGLCGFADAPLRVGQLLIVQLEEMLMPAAAVVWARRSSTGLRFLRPVPPARFESLCARHESGAAWSPAMRAGSDLHSWWTNVQEQQEGRRARLDADGHAHPLPR